MFSTTSIVLFVTLCASIDAVKIHTPQGEIEGVHKTSHKGRRFECFYGIPYAKAPVGNLRFHAPEPYGKWHGTRDGSKEGHVCLQNAFMDEEVIGSEDCLFINVYTPNASHHKRYPVLVWIHGGGFTGGTGNSLYYLPDYLLDKDIVLVTVNYRLGALGFASTEDEVMPGNYGLKDQVLALKWVKHHIASYGGNHEKVTILGQSAGAASVHLHTMSPLSKGLFHRAIIMSGSAYSPWATTAKSVVAHRTRRLATHLGCTSTHTSHAVLNCLRHFKTASEFVKVMPRFLIWEIDPVTVFIPVVEKKDVEDAFLTENPFHLNTSVPMIVGMTSGEGSIRVATFHKTGGILVRLEQLDQDFDKVIPVSLLFDQTARYPTELAKRVRKHYFGDKKVDKHSIHHVTDMYTDSWYTQAITRTVKRNFGSTHMYLFDYRGTHSLTETLTNSTHNYGVCHADDLQYLFPLTTYVPNYKHLSHDDKKMQELLLNLWVNFVIHGTPTPSDSQLNWHSAQGNNLDYLHISLEPKMKKHFLSERNEFWQQLSTRDKEY